MKTSFCGALNQALVQEMERDTGVFCHGVGLGTRDMAFGSIRGLPERFPGRIIDTPVSEESLMGFSIGAAINGLHPIQHHIRCDFLLLTMNQLVNMAAPYAYSTCGKGSVPMVIRSVIGRGFGQGWQHSKSLASWFTHVPGLKVVLPTTPTDAKGLLAGAVRDGNPVVFLEHRWLYWSEAEVPDGELVTSLDSNPGEILRSGSHVTIVAFSWMAVEALQAAEFLAEHHKLDCEVINPKVVTPLDPTLIVRSVQKTTRCFVVEPDWVPCGLGSEVLSILAERGVLLLTAARIGWEHTPCPTARHQEEEFYPSARTIVRRIESSLGLKPADLSSLEIYSNETVRKWTGPF